MNDRIKSALIGGVVLGILSAIPGIKACCCIWALIGGLVAVYLYVKKSPTPVTTGDGAILGAIAGAIGIAFIVIIGIPLQLVAGAAMVSLIQSMVPPDQAAQMNALTAGETIGSAIMSAVVISIVGVIFSAIGGLIGVAIFEKRKGGAGVPPPPPPPAAGGFGGPGV